MAEIVLKIGEGSGYQDGDVLAAFNRSRIRCVHAQHLCHPREAGVTREGLLPRGSLCHKYFELTHQYRFERTAYEEVKRTEIATGTEEIISATPNKLGEYMHVAEFIRRRFASGDHAIFGELGKEVWYGGRINHSDEVLDSVWLQIASKTNRTEDEREHRLWPYGRFDIRHHLAVRVEDFSHEESDALVSPQVDIDQDGKPVLRADSAGVLKEKVLARRNIRVDWRKDLLDELQVTEQQVLDRTIPVGQDVAIYFSAMSETEIVVDDERQPFIYESKDQPLQADRSKLQSRSLGGRLPRG